MKELIISDIHNRTRWIEPFLSQYKKEHGYDRVIFLADYFDQFGDGPFEARGTAIWLKYSLQYKDRVHLLGNHDMPYMVPRNPSLWCPGWTKEKWESTRDVLKPEDWDQLRPCVYTQGWLLSHAGASPKIFQHPVNGMTAESVVAQSEEALKRVKMGLEQREFGYGWRMSSIKDLLIPQGGITWAHWDNEFVPVEGIKQIVGHTTFNKPQEKDGNWCMDTNNQHVGVLEDGVLSFTQCHGVVHKKRGHVVAQHRSYFSNEEIAEEIILAYKKKHKIP